MFWVHIALVSPYKVVKLVVDDEAVSTPSHDTHNLCRMFILLALPTLFPSAMLNGIAKHRVKDEIN